MPMIDLINDLTKLNRTLTLDEDLEGFTVSPTLRNEHADVHALLFANKDRILELLNESNTLITAIETWAKDDSNKWKQAHSKFLKDYQPIPYIQDAHDDLISWLHANQRITSAREKIQKLQGKKNKSEKDKVALNARYSDIYAYLTIASGRRCRLITNLLLHSDLYGQINGFMDKQNGKKKEAITSQ